MPFGPYENFAECVADQKKKGYGEEEAKRICGKLQSDLEERGKKEEDTKWRIKSEYDNHLLKKGDD